VARASFFFLPTISKLVLLFRCSKWSVETLLGGGVQNVMQCKQRWFRRDQLRVVVVTIGLLIHSSPSTKVKICTAKTIMTNNSNNYNYDDVKLHQW